MKIHFIYAINNLSVRFKLTSCNICCKYYFVKHVASRNQHLCKYVLFLKLVVSNELTQLYNYLFNIIYDLCGIIIIFTISSGNGNRMKRPIPTKI